MRIDIGISQGQQEARARWGTHESGAEFDRKKRSFLTEAAREFISQQVMCIVVGPGPEQEPCGLLITGRPGFVELPDEHTCLIPIDRQYEESYVIQGVHHALACGSRPQMALCLLQHATRQRICVQGAVEILSDLPDEALWLRLSVSLAFFHCPKYIRTRVHGLHFEGEKTWPILAGQAQDYLTEEVQTFLARQSLCYLCTIDQQGQCAVNHRGGAAGFLVTLAPDRLIPGGLVLLPDYAGNGAFEAVGNILETGRAALLVPSYADQLALCISGSATVLEPPQLPAFLREKCRGAQRVVAITVNHIESQHGDWSAALDYERTRVKIFEEAKQAAHSCQF